MKCKKCGANLEIDHAFCPYWGVKNPIAQKHREDMKRFAKDYADTKKEVIDNTKKFNRKTFFMTIIAITFVLVAILVLINVFGSKIRYKLEKDRKLKNTFKYTEQVEDLINKEDYLGLAILKDKYGLKTYDTPIEKYNEIIRASEIYSDIFEYTLICLYDKEPSSIIDAGSISEYCKSLYDLLGRTQDSYAESEVTKVVKELNLFFETYLDLTKEETESFPRLTEAQRSMIIEEAIEN